MALSGLWGTWFSREQGRAMKGFPRNWLKKIQIISGEVMTTEQVNLAMIEAKVRMLRGNEV